MVSAFSIVSRSGVPVEQPGPRSIEALLARYREAVPQGVVDDRWGAPSATMTGSR